MITERRELVFLTPDNNVYKTSLRQFALQNLRQARTKIQDRLTTLVESDTLKNILSYKTSQEQDDLTQHLADLQKVSQERTDFWLNGFYQDDDHFDNQVNTKAEDYTQNDGGDPKENYLKALGNRHDQTMAVIDYFRNFAEKVEEIKEITDEDKNLAAYHLAEKIREYGADLVKAEDREKVIASGQMTKEEVEVSLRSGLIQYADVEPEFNKEGFTSDEEWDQAVFETAAGLLEDQLIQKISEAASTDEDKEIYNRALDIYHLRTPEPTPIVTISPVELTPEGEIAEDTKAPEETPEPDDGNAPPTKLATVARGAGHLLGKIVKKVGS
ncbi:MAG: hypothetical protein HYW45_03700 [Candidatus Daviesbacteria bacterium]|nr:MAG: hypothetical protein HYW45_03700 [Candidatus Daviesbacteria bacterium]